MYADVFGASECAKGQRLRWRDSVFTYMHWGPAVEQRVQGPAVRTVSLSF